MRWLLALMMLVLLVSLVQAHEWYHPACCSDRDCRPANAGEVVFAGDGWYVEKYQQTIPLGDWRAQKSKDHQIHICEAETYARCVYIPDPGT